MHRNSPRFKAKTVVVGVGTETRCLKREKAGRLLQGEASGYAFQFLQFRGAACSDEDMGVLVTLCIEFDQRLGIIRIRLIEPFGGFAEQSGFASGLSLPVETRMTAQIQPDTSAGIPERNHFLKLVNLEVDSILNAGAIRRRQVDGELSIYGGC